MEKKCFIFIIALSIFFVSCNERNDVEKSLPIKKADINILSQFSLNYREDLLCDSNSLIYYTSKYFDTSFVIHIVKQDSLFKGVCYFVPSVNKKGIIGSGSENAFLFSGFNFILNENKWREIKTEYQGLNLTFDKNVCLDCSFMFASTNGLIKSGYLNNDNKFNTFIVKKIIHPNLSSILNKF